MERWGVQAILGDNPPFLEIVRISRLLSVFRVFQKSATPGGLKNMTPDERQLMASTMARIVQADD
jgi:hypothetical protein